ncbi:T9SS type A sorting domain-containing protein [Pontibacter sp. H259]|uniref:T9SS type A sorting domain-containing protein n=1 Tax=Pontibacter sp. H259 TaxID=3133421 RepID=UPI0030BE4F59
MKELINYTSRTRNVLSEQLQQLWRYAMVMAAVFAFSVNANAQSHPVCEKPNGDPDPPHCVSQDLTVASAFLTSDQCACTSGQSITADLNFNLINKTGSERTSFAVFAILVKENPDGTTESVYFKACTSPVPPGSTSTITFNDAVTYTCGQSLILTDVYLAWTDASDGDRTQCGGAAGLLNNFCAIDPKCGKPADIRIAPLLTASVTDTDGTCEGENDGTLTVTASGGTGPYDFVITPGGTTVSNDADGVYTFTGLASGNYSITVEDAEGCEITVQGTVPEFQEPDIPTVSVTQPSCTVQTGTIVVTSSTTGLLFSLNGAAFAAYPTNGYTGLEPGNYTLVAQNTNGCISDVRNVTINDAPIVPSGIAADVDQPDCTTPTGTITFTSPLDGGGVDYQYSIDGGANFVDNPIFANLAPDDYDLRVRSADGCVAIGSTVTIEDAPIVPSGIVADVDQPTCTVATGTITFTSPLDAGGIDYEYSIDAGANYDDDPVFANLAPGTYNLRVRSGDGCVESGGQVVIEDAPIVPAGITTDVDQPTCTTPTGRIEFLTPLGDYTYSINGGTTYQASPVFANLAPGTYNLSVLSGDGCAASGGQVIINNVPASPTVMVSAATSRCVNNVPTVTITATPSGGSGTGYTFDWSVPTGAIDPGNVASFDATVAGTYSVVVEDSRGCTGSGSVVPTFAPCQVLQGCTPGYWKQAQHFGNWECDYVPTGPNATKFFDVFSGVTIYRGLNPDMTLLEALNLNGGKFQALARHAAAAILNACSDINYQYSEAQVRAMVTTAFNSGNWSTAHNNLATANERGCPLGRAELTYTSSSSLEGVLQDRISAYPTPFSDKATIEFSISKTENYVVNLYDMKGALVKQLKAGTAKAGELQLVEVDGTNLNEGLYIARMISDSGAKSVKLLLKRE